VPTELARRLRAAFVSYQVGTTVRDPVQEHAGRRQRFVVVGRRNAIIEWKQQFANSRSDIVTRCYNAHFILDLILALLAVGRVEHPPLRPLEVVALRQQVAGSDGKIHNQH
jgi:hypothetical protein